MALADYLSKKKICHFTHPRVQSIKLVRANIFNIQRLETSSYSKAFRANWDPRTRKSHCASGWLGTRKYHMFMLPLPPKWLTSIEEMPYSLAVFIFEICLKQNKAAVQSPHARPYFSLSFPLVGSIDSLTGFEGICSLYAKPAFFSRIIQIFLIKRNYISIVLEKIEDGLLWK